MLHSLKAVHILSGDRCWSEHHWSGCEARRAGSYCTGLNERSTSPAYPRSAVAAAELPLAVTWVGVLDRPARSATGWRHVLLSSSARSSIAETALTEFHQPAGTTGHGRRTAVGHHRACGTALSYRHNFASYDDIVVACPFSLQTLHGGTKRSSSYFYAYHTRPCCRSCVCTSVDAAAISRRRRPQRHPVGQGTGQSHDSSPFVR
jgi:hypothetical protein